MILLLTGALDMKLQKGFSLLEILIYVAIISVITLTIGTVFVSLNRGQSKVDVKNEVNSNVLFALEKLKQDFLAATAVTVPASAGATSTTLGLTISSSTTTYCVITGRLRRATSGAACDASAQAVTSDKVIVDSLNFIRLENTNTVLSKTVVSVQTTITASFNSVSPDQQYTETKQTTSSLR
ncbi:MAG: hypothetical protein UW89_C0008G0002 [Parcubacteria group bacterium GW2011_GWB1_45_10]|nr:MAG: hypothetical protein UW89_C0008G0002 [Parcubacteria group bacterium GW2011_GWB1_45_10]